MQASKTIIVDTNSVAKDFFLVSHVGAGAQGFEPPSTACSGCKQGAADLSSSCALALSLGGPGKKTQSLRFSVSCRCFPCMGPNTQLGGNFEVSYGFQRSRPTSGSLGTHLCSKGGHSQCS